MGVRIKRDIELWVVRVKEIRFDLDTCAMCPHYERVGDLKGYGRARVNQCKTTRREFGMNPHIRPEIPEDCPLPDAPDDKEKR